MNETSSTSRRSWSLHPGWLVLLAALLTFGAVTLPIWIRFQREQRIVREVARRGSYDIREAGPDWLRWHLYGTHMSLFDRVVGLRLFNGEIDDGFLLRLESLDRLEYLYFYECPISDADLKHFLRLKRLTVLGFEGTQVTDTGVQQLRKTLPGCSIEVLPRAIQ